MLRLFLRVSLREHRHHWGRALLVLLGVATGIALVVAMDLVNTSVLAGFRSTFAALVGPADLEVTLGIGEVGFAEEAVDVVRRDPGVAAAIPLVRGTVTLADDPGEVLHLFGMELNAEDDLARYGSRLVSGRREALAALTDPRAVLITDAFAARLGLAVGSTLRLATPRGVDTFTVRGTLATDGIARVVGGQLVVMDLEAAQTQLVKERRLDEIDVVLHPGSDAETIRARLQAALPASLTVGTPETRATRYADILAGLQATFDGMSMLSVLAGLFIAFNATATGVVHRAPVIGALRLIGADARQLRALLLAEAVGLGTLGAACGVGIGIAMARLLVSVTSTVMGTMTQMRLLVPDFPLSPGRVTVLGSLGIVVALAAAWIPAAQATRLEPLDVARGNPDASASVPLRPLSFVAAGLIVLTAGIFLVGEHWHLIIVSAAGSSVLMTAALVVCVIFVSILGTRLSRPLQRVFGIPGRVAAANVARTPIRTGVTAGAIMIAFALALTIANLTASYLATADEYIRELHDGDLAVSAVGTEGGWLETPISAEVAAEIARMPGVHRVESLRIVPGQTFRDGRIGLVAFEPDALARLGPGLWRAGDRLEGRAALAAGRGVVVSTILCDRFGLALGDRLELATPSGVLALPVVGVIQDISSNSGTVMLSRPLYAQWWQDPSVSRVNVYLEPGTSIEDARRAITARLADRYRVKTLALRENLAYHEDKIRRAFAFADTLQILVAIVTVAGIFDLLFSGVLERRRELALYRLIGANDGAVRRTIVIESLAIAALAAIMGVVVGVVTSKIWVLLLIPRLIGYDLLYAYAVTPTFVSIALVLLMTAVAGWAAAMRATRASVLEGMRL
jgi:putative ABC transport system permease protein